MRQYSERCRKWSLTPLFAGAMMLAPLVSEVPYHAQDSDALSCVPMPSMSLVSLLALDLATGTFLLCFAASEASRASGPSRRRHAHQRQAGSRLQWTPAVSVTLLWTNCTRTNCTRTNCLKGHGCIH